MAAYFPNYAKLDIDDHGDACLNVKKLSLVVQHTKQVFKQPDNHISLW